MSLHSADSHATSLSDHFVTVCERDSQIWRIQWKYFALWPSTTNGMHFVHLIITSVFNSHSCLSIKEITVIISFLMILLEENLIEQNNDIHSERVHQAQNIIVLSILNDGDYSHTFYGQYTIDNHMFNHTWTSCRSFNWSDSSSDKWWIILSLQNIDGQMHSGWKKHQINHIRLSNEFTGDLCVHSEKLIRDRRGLSISLMI